MLVLLTYPLSSVFFPDITILLTSVRRGGGCPPASGKMYLRKGRKHHVGRGNTEVKGGSSAPWEGRFSLWRGGDLHLSMFMLLLSPAIFLMRKYHTWANLKYFTTHMFHDFQSLERTRILQHLKVKYCKEWVMKSLAILSTQRKKKKKKWWNGSSCCYAIISALWGCWVKLQEAGSPSENSRHAEVVSTQQILLVLGEFYWVNQQ